MPAAQPPAPPRYVSLGTAAERHSTSRRTIRRRIADGSLKAYRVGPRLIRVDVEELDKLLRPIPAGNSDE